MAVCGCCKPFRTDLVARPTRLWALKCSARSGERPLALAGAPGRRPISMHKCTRPRLRPQRPHGPIPGGLSEDDWRRQLDVNLTSVFLMCKQVIPVMEAPSLEVSHCIGASSEQGVCSPCAPPRTIFASIELRD